MSSSAEEKIITHLPREAIWVSQKLPCISYINAAKFYGSVKSLIQISRNLKGFIIYESRSACDYTRYDVR